MTSLLPEPRVWRNGVLVREKDLDASGEPPHVESEQPQPLVWQEVERAEGSGVEYRNCCIEARFDKRGRKFYRAIARIDDPDYPGESIKCSKEYKAYDEADARPVNAYAQMDAREAQENARISAAVARSHMNVKTDAAMSDMRRIMAELYADIMFPYKRWQIERDRELAHKREQAAARVQLRLAFEALADEPDLLAMLRELVKDG